MNLEISVAITKVLNKINELSPGYPKTEQIIPTGKILHDLHKVMDSPPLTLAFAAQGAANPKLRVLVVNFDGTGNDRFAVPSGENQTLISEMATNFEAQSILSKPKGLDGTTSGLPIIESIYVKGVGTKGSPISRKSLQSNGFLSRSASLATGATCVERAELAYWAAMELAKKWMDEDPLCKIHVHVTGFSRGAASALCFMNLIYENGFIGLIENERKAKGMKPGMKEFPQGMRASVFDGVTDKFGYAQVPMTAVLIDTVATGQHTNEYLGRELSFPPTVLSALHLIAGGEERSLFSVVDLAEEMKVSYHGVANSVLRRNGKTIAFLKPSIDGFEIQRVQTVIVPGARHSDAGGCFSKSGYTEVMRYLIGTFNASAGLPVTPVKPDILHVQSVRPTDLRYKTDQIRGFLHNIMSGVGRHSGGRESIAPRGWLRHDSCSLSMLNFSQEALPKDCSVTVLEDVSEKFPQLRTAFNLLNRRNPPYLNEIKESVNIAKEAITHLSSDEYAVFWNVFVGTLSRSIGDLALSDYLHDFAEANGLEVSYAEDYGDRIAGKRPDPIVKYSITERNAR